MDKNPVDCQTLPFPPTKLDRAAIALVQHMLLSATAYRGRLVGIEMEFFVVDAKSFEPVGVDGLLGDGMDDGGFLRPELSPFQLEVGSEALWDLVSLRDGMAARLQRLSKAAGENGLRLLPAALYEPAANRISSGERYATLAEVFGPEFVRHAPSVAADQINVGARDEDEAFRTFAAFRSFLPLFMALSAASPLRGGRLSGISSNRMLAYDRAMSRCSGQCGIPQRYGSHLAWMQAIHAQDFFQSAQCDYHYVRPMPHRGVAAELRCLDKQPRLGDLMALVALAKALVIAVDRDAREILDQGCDEEELESGFVLARERGIRALPEIHADPQALLESLGGLLSAAEQPIFQRLFDTLSCGPADELRAVVERCGEQQGYVFLADALQEELDALT